MQKQIKDNTVSRFAVMNAVHDVSPGIEEGRGRRGGTSNMEDHVIIELSKS